MNTLLNTSWQLAFAPTISADVTYSVTFECQGVTYNSLVFDSTSGRILYDNTAVYYEGWLNSNYRTIKFTGGTDIADANLISWIEANAEQVLTQKEIFERDMAELRNAINLKARTTGTKTIKQMTEAVNSIPSGGGEQPQLNAPTISISGTVLTITNPATNGNFTSGYKILVDNVETYETSNTTYDLSAISANTASITVKAVGTNFTDSNASNSVTYYHYYTVNMYDDDETTLLQTESVRYGLMPSYVPTKSTATFVRWEDANGNTVTQITADTNLYAVWVEKIMILAGNYIGKLGLVFNLPFTKFYINTSYKDSYGNTVTGDGFTKMSSGGSIYTLYSTYNPSGTQTSNRLCVFTSGEWQWNFINADRRITVTEDTEVMQGDKTAFLYFFEAEQ